MPRFNFRTVTSKHRHSANIKTPENIKKDDTGIAMKKNAKQIDGTDGLSAVIRSTGTESPTLSSIAFMHERRLRLTEDRDVTALPPF